MERVITVLYENGQKEVISKNDSVFLSNLYGWSWVYLFYMPSEIDDEIKITRN